LGGGGPNYLAPALIDRVNLSIFADFQWEILAKVTFLRRFCLVQFWLCSLPYTWN